MNKATGLRLILTGIVTTGIFKISAGHIMDVAQRYGNGSTDAVVYPIAIDGMILISALTLIAGVGVTKVTKMYAQVGRWVGFAMTIYANMLHAGWTSTDSVIINLIPAIALIITVEIMVNAAKLTPAAKRRTATVTKLKVAK